MVVRRDEGASSTVKILPNADIKQCYSIQYASKKIVLVTACNTALNHISNTTIDNQFDNFVFSDNKDHQWKFGISENVMFFLLQEKHTGRN